MTSSVVKYSAIPNSSSLCCCSIDAITISDSVEFGSFNISSNSSIDFCLYNSLAENFFGLLKSELFYLNNYDNIETLEKDIKNYIDYYNNSRIKLKLNGMSPVQFRTHSMEQVA